jgi:two-component system phosphate regulon sensor histidine kinase PhoR
MAVMLIATLAVILVTSGISSSNVRHELESYTHNLASVVEQGGVNRLDAISAYPFRVTLIRPDGGVLFDSGADASTMSNHFMRKEVQEAIANGSGSDARYSATLSERTHYYALKLADGRILRCSYSVDTVFRGMGRLISYLAIIVIASALVSCFTARIIARRITEPLNRIDLDNPLENDVYDELTPLIERISSQQRHIADQLEEIRGQSEELAAVTSNMTDGLVILNADGEVLSINNSAMRILGADESCVGHSFLAVDRSDYVRQFFEEGRGERSRSCEFEREGQIYKVFFNRVGSETGLHGYALIYIDVTAARKAERQRQEFTANVSHELKTPLQSIIGAAELLESGLVKEDDRQDFYRRIGRQGHALLGMINDIIFLSRLDEGKARESMEDLDVAAVCRDAFKGLEDKAGARNISLQLEGSCAPYRGIYRYLYELVFNLSENAVKYGREGGHVKVSLSDREGGGCVIKVSDDGIGIPPEDQEHVFERFYRVDKSHSKRSEGTGLGLSIVKRVALFFGGSVSLQSEPGRGSEFTVELPLREEPSEDAPESAKTQGA